MQDYRVVGHMGEGTFSEVLKCQSHVDGKLYACKKMKQKYSSIEQVNNLREVQALRRLNPHPNIVELKEVIFDKQSNSLALICELMDMNIYELIKDRKTYLSEQRVRIFMYQLCKSIYHMHKNGIFHRDVKPENILIKGNVLKLADFGSCKSVYSKHPYTEYISTRWYRAPECLLTDGHYGHEMDMWSVGCVMFEIITLRPLFPGSDELDQMSRIHEVLSTPSPIILQKFRKNQSRHMKFNFPPKIGSGLSPLLKHGSKGCIDLITQLCTYDPDARLTAKQALRHPYFRELREAEMRAKEALRSSSNSSGVASSRLQAPPNKSNQTSRRYHRKPHLEPVRLNLRNNQIASIPEVYDLNGKGSPTINRGPNGPAAGKHGYAGPVSKHGYAGRHIPYINSKSSHHQIPLPMPTRYSSVIQKGSSQSTLLPSIYGSKVTTKNPSLSSSKHFRKHYLPSHHATPSHHKPHLPPHLPSIAKHRTGAG